MVSASRRWALVFNGEIYNSHELIGHFGLNPDSLRSTSDTEVLVESIDRAGIRPVLDRALGMFAIAAYDTVERRLWLTRDRLGIKPLYALQSGRGVAFASEARAFHGCPLFTGRGNPAAAYRCLDRLSVDPDSSILTGVEQVRPGELRGYTAHGPGRVEPERHQHWSIPAAPSSNRSRMRGSRWKNSRL